MGKPQVEGHWHTLIGPATISCVSRLLRDPDMYTRSSREPNADWMVELTPGIWFIRVPSVYPQHRPPRPPLLDLQLRRC
jgi:hypothetical protein